MTQSSCQTVYILIYYILIYIYILIYSQVLNNGSMDRVEKIGRLEAILSAVTRDVEDTQLTGAFFAVDFNFFLVDLNFFFGRFQFFYW